MAVKFSSDTQLSSSSDTILSPDVSAVPTRRGINPGRDLVSAIIMGIFLGAIVLVSLWLSALAWYVVLSGACIVSLWEATRHLSRLNVQVPVFFLYLFGQIILWSSYFYQSQGLLIASIAAFLVLMIGQLFMGGLKSPPHNYVLSVAMSFFLLVWIPIMISCAGLLMLAPHGAGRVLCFMIIAIGSDVGGYFAGIVFGKHALASAISPKKTWEGLIGSLICGTIISSISLHYLGFDWIPAICTGPVLVIIATCGDLVESQFKRELGIKDMSNLLPGHGGLLDRLDSILPSAGAAWLLWYVIS